MTAMDTERGADEVPQPCPRCKGEGYFDDVRFAGVTHRRTAIRRKCRNCKGTGEKPSAAPVEPATSEIPDWMLG